jgi:DNA-binding NtrC family response regulator
MNTEFALIRYPQALRVAPTSSWFQFRANADRSGAAAGNGPGGFLSGHTLLVVEDDLFVGLELAQILEEMGGGVVGPLRTIAAAEQAVAAGGFDIAILDVNIGGKYVFGIAETLEARRLPVLFVTAYATDDRLFPDAMREIPRLPKPVQPMALLHVLRRMV